MKGGPTVLIVRYEQKRTSVWCNVIRKAEHVWSGSDFSHEVNTSKSSNEVKAGVQNPPGAIQDKSQHELSRVKDEELLQDFSYP